MRPLDKIHESRVRVVVISDGFVILFLLYVELTFISSFMRKINCLIVGKTYLTQIFFFNLHVNTISTYIISNIFWEFWLYVLKDLTSDFLIIKKKKSLSDWYPN